MHFREDIKGKERAQRRANRTIKGLKAGVGGKAEGTRCVPFGEKELDQGRESSFQVFERLLQRNGRDIVLSCIKLHCM